MFFAGFALQNMVETTLPDVLEMLCLPYAGFFFIESAHWADSI
jgi:hypothetical protein